MDTFVVLSLVPGIFYAASSIPWSSVFLLTRWCGLRFYILRDVKSYKAIQRNIYGWSSTTTDDDKACGYSFGRWYCLYIDEEKVWLVSTPTSCRILLTENDEVVSIV
jgi:hypothetical protein